MNSNTFERVDTQVHFLKPILYSEYGELKKKRSLSWLRAGLRKEWLRLRLGKLMKAMN